MALDPAILKESLNTMRPTIFSYWSDRGFALGQRRRNTLVELCWRTVRRNSGCDSVLLTPEKCGELIDFDERWLRLHPPHQSDLVRLRVLHAHGGMWLDADTIVRTTLQPLFDLLEAERLDCIGCDWRPQKRPDEHQTYAVGVMGPMRPGQRFIRVAIEGQDRLLEQSAAWLEEPTDHYPFKWGALLSELVSPAFEANPPQRHCLLPGASGWLGLTGSEVWSGGDFPNALDPAARVSDLTRRLQAFPLLGLSNSLYPSEFTCQPEDELLSSDTIAGMLLREALAV